MSDIEKVLKGIRLYCTDTLSGCADGTISVAWYRGGYVEIIKRCDSALSDLRDGKKMVVDADDFAWLTEHISEEDTICSECPVRQKIISCAEFVTCAEAFKAYFQLKIGE